MATLHRTPRLLAVVLAPVLALTACGGAGTDAGASAPALSSSTAPEPADAATGPTPADGAVCPSDVFQLEVNDVQRSDGYDDPELSVTCTDDTMTVTSNNMIAYEFVPMTPNDLAAVEFSYEIPLEPVQADTPGAIGLGTIGVAVNGVTIFGAFEAPQDGYRDPLLDGLLDFCNGHTAPGGVYHYHARFDCILDDPTAPEAVIGYLYDGYEIVTPYACTDAACSDSYEVASGYVRTDPDGLGAFDAWEYQEGAGDLDECNGMVGADGVYRYYVTDAFPYVPFCYHGITDAAQGDFDGSAPDGGGPRP